MTESQLEDGTLAYSGWAPCAHTIDEILDQKENFLTKDLEELLWTMSLIAEVDIACDQWVGVKVEGTIGELKYRTYIQADNFHAAFMESYNKWSEKYKQQGLVLEDDWDC